MRTAATNTGRSGKHVGYSDIPLYDDGGDVDADGKHQLAILQDGEKVLTSAEARAYDAQGAPSDFGGRVIANPKGIKPVWDAEIQRRTDEPTKGAHMSTDNAPLIAPTDDTSNAPTRREVIPTDISTNSADQKRAAQDKVNNPGAQTTKMDSTETAIAPRTEAPDAERAAVRKDQQDALGMGIPGMTKLGLANVHAKQLGMDPISLSALGGEAPTTTTQLPIPVAGPDMHQAKAGGPLSTDSGSTSETKREQSDLAQMEYKGKLAQMKQDHANALAERTPEGKVKADYIQAQINDFQKNNPWGSAGNHPGFLGKLGHIASTIGNIAGDIVAPSTMELIPGTQLNKAAKAAGLQKITQEDVESAGKIAKGGDKDAWDVVPNAVGPNGRSVLKNKIDGTMKEAPEGYTPYKDASANKGTDQATFVSQWYKDNPAAVKSAMNDAKAIREYHSAEAPPVTLMEPVPGHPGMLQARQVQPGEQISEEAGKPGAAAAEEAKYRGKTFYYDNPDGSGRQAYTYAELKAAGLKPEDAEQQSATAVAKDRDKGESYNAIRKSFTEYHTDLDDADHKGTLSESDITALKVLTGDEAETTFADKLAGSLVDAVSAFTDNPHPITGYSQKFMGSTLTKQQYTAMSPAARQVLADYYTAMMAHFANMKATQGTIPRNPAIIQTEMHTVPKPYLNADESEPAFDNYLEGVEGRNHNNVKFGTDEKDNEGAAAGKGLTVQTPAGAFTFRTQEDADAFRKKAGL
jgi:hypothetical protein